MDNKIGIFFTVWIILSLLILKVFIFINKGLNNEVNDFYLCQKKWYLEYLWSMKLVFLTIWTEFLL